MAWLQLKIDINDDQREALEAQLEQLGALAITLEDAGDTPLFEPPPGTTPLWKAQRLTALFDSSADIDAIAQQLSLPAGEYRAEALEDKDWTREWMSAFKPMRFGQSLWVCPSWLEPPEPDAINLILDPGMAFGTGTHATTALCLRWLEQLDWSTEPELIDYGCGSGILAIGGLLLGARHAYGIDNDPQALISSQQNAESNGVAERLDVYAPFQHKESTDIVIANILAGPLIELAPTLATLVKKGGHIGLSGILEEQAEAIRERYSEWFRLDPTQQQDDWVFISGVRS